ncbi:MAG: hypothetical protein KDJ35_07500 [Alphaproteobacteria bacterium]|nr:hypothetical protein [Alphaproteobacteria bacterium]
MNLRNTLKKWTVFPLAALAFNAAVRAQQSETPKDSVNINGFSRGLLELGDRGGNFSYSELVLNVEKGNWALQLSPDLVERAGNNREIDFNIQTSIATLAYNTENLIYKAGIFAPFNQRISGAEFDNGLPGAYLGDKLTIQSGILGGQIQWTKNISEKSEVRLHGIGGTRIAELGNAEQNEEAGYQTVVWALGGQTSYTMPFDILITTNYNFTNFGEGRTGQKQETHYIATHLGKNLGPVSVLALGEVEYNIIRNLKQNTKMQSTSYVVMGQASGPLKNNFGWRAAAGIENDNEALEGFITYKAKNWAAQIGGGTIKINDKLSYIGNTVLIYRF